MLKFGCVAHADSIQLRIPNERVSVGERLVRRAILGLLPPETGECQALRSHLHPGTEPPPTRVSSNAWQLAICCNQQALAHQLLQFVERNRRLINVADETFEAAQVSRLKGLERSWDTQRTGASQVQVVDPQICQRPFDV